MAAIATPNTFSGTQSTFRVCPVTMFKVDLAAERLIIWNAVTAIVALTLGGTYALLSGDTLLYGPNKTGEIELVGSKAEDHLASFAGNHMIAAGSMFFLHTDTDLSALDRARFVKLFAERRGIGERREKLTKQLAKATPQETKAMQDELAELGLKLDDVTAALGRCIAWKVSCDYPYSLALSGATLVAGGYGKVASFDAASGKEIWKADVPGNAYGLAVADQQLYVSSDQGTIHCFGAER